MNQNSIIAFALLVGFVVFVTMRGELQRYLSVIGLATNGAGSATSGALPSLPSLPNLFQ
jgi:hypothetical protein